ncbi:FtsW/RodA/SpoVE family cell cycle protein [Candidatus Hydrogenedentota bacterium]
MKSSVTNVTTTEGSQLLLITLALLCVGLIMVYSSSAYEVGGAGMSLGQTNIIDNPLFIKSIIYAAIGLGAMALTMIMPLGFWRHTARIWLVLAIGVLIYVLKYGIVINHARRWINLEPFGRVQPAEAAKLALIIYLAAFCASRVGKPRTLKNMYLPAMFFLILFCGLVAAEHDLSTPAVMGSAAMATVFLGGFKLTWMLGTGLLGLVPLSYMILSSADRVGRILAFIDPWKDPTGDGYQLIQSLVAFSEGGFWGKGLGYGTQKLGYLCGASHNDFIFAIIGEELGFVGAGCVLLLFMLFLIQGIKIAFAAKDPFAAVLVGGLTALLVLQAATNMGVAAGLLPTTGLSLPFISYGGSSLVCSMAATGMIIKAGQYVHEE